MTAPVRIGWILIAFLATSACGSAVPSESVLRLPDETAALPDTFAEAAAWTPMEPENWPTGFDRDISFESPQGAADALIAALEEAWSGSEHTPLIEAERIESQAERALVIVTEAGSTPELPIPGSQVALELDGTADGWSIAAAWRRTLCWPSDAALAC